MSDLQEEMNGIFLGFTDCMSLCGTQLTYPKEWHVGTGMHMYPNTSGFPSDNINEFKKKHIKKMDLRVRRRGSLTLRMSAWNGLILIKSFM